MKQPLKVLVALIYLAVTISLACPHAQAYTPARERGEVATPLSRVVTASEYAAFLNAVAASDADHLFNGKMATDSQAACIVRVGAPGRWQYEVIEGREYVPVCYVSQQDEARYCVEEECSLASASPLEMIESTSFANGGYAFEVDSFSSPLLMWAEPSSDRYSSIASISEVAALLGLLVVPELMVRRGSGVANLRETISAARSAPEDSALDASSDDASDASLESCASSRSVASARTTASMGKRNQYTLGLVDFTQAALEYPTADRLIIDEGDTEQIIPSKFSLDPRNITKNMKENKTIALAFKDVLRKEYPREFAGSLIPGQRDSVWDSFSGSFSLGSAKIFQYINKVEKRMTEDAILGTKKSDLKVLKSHMERKKIIVAETQEFHQKHQTLFEAKSGEKMLSENSTAPVESLVDAMSNAHLVGLPIGPVIKTLAAGARKGERMLQEAPLKLAKKIAAGAKKDYDLVEERWKRLKRREDKKKGTNPIRGDRFDDATSTTSPTPQDSIDSGVDTSVRVRTKPQSDHMALWQEAMGLETAAEFAAFKVSKSDTPANRETYLEACRLAKMAWTTAAEAREAAANNKSSNERDKNLLLADVTTAEEKADDWGRALKEARAKHNALASSAPSLREVVRIQDDEAQALGKQRAAELKADQEGSANKSDHEREDDHLLADLTKAEEKADDSQQGLKEEGVTHNATVSNGAIVSMALAPSRRSVVRIQDDEAQASEKQQVTELKANQEAAVKLAGEEQEQREADRLAGEMKSNEEAMVRAAAEAEERLKEDQQATAEAMVLEARLSSREAELKKAKTEAAKAKLRADAKVNEVKIAAEKQAEADAEANEARLAAAILEARIVAQEAIDKKAAADAKLEEAKARQERLAAIEAELKRAQAEAAEVKAMADQKALEVKRASEAKALADAKEFEERLVRETREASEKATREAEEALRKKKKADKQAAKKAKAITDAKADQERLSAAKAKAEEDANIAAEREIAEANTRTPLNGEEQTLVKERALVEQLKSDYARYKSQAASAKSKGKAADQIDWEGCAGHAFLASDQLEKAIKATAAGEVEKAEAFRKGALEEQQQYENKSKFIHDRIEVEARAQAEIERTLAAEKAAEKAAARAAREAKRIADEKLAAEARAVEEREVAAMTALIEELKVSQATYEAKMAISRAAGKEQQSTSWQNAAKSASLASVRLAEAIQAKADGRLNAARYWREAALKNQEASEDFAQAAEQHASANSAHLFARDTGDLDNHGHNKLGIAEELARPAKFYQSQISIIKEGVAEIKALEALPCGYHLRDKEARANDVLNLIRKRMWPTFARALGEFRTTPNEETLAMARGVARAYGSGTAIGSAFARNGEEASEAAEAAEVIAEANQKLADGARVKRGVGAGTKQNLEWLAMTAREVSLFAQCVEEYQTMKNAGREKAEWRRVAEPGEAAFQEARRAKSEDSWNEARRAAESVAMRYARMGEKLARGKRGPGGVTLEEVGEEKSHWLQKMGVAEVKALALRPCSRDLSGLTQRANEVTALAREKVWSALASSMEEFVRDPSEERITKIVRSASSYACASASASAFAFAAASVSSSASSSYGDGPGHGHAYASVSTYASAYAYNPQAYYGFHNYNGAYAYTYASSASAYASASASASAISAASAVSGAETAEIAEAITTLVKETQKNAKNVSSGKKLIKATLDGAVELTSKTREFVRAVVAWREGPEAFERFRVAAPARRAEAEVEGEAEGEAEAAAKAKAAAEAEARAKVKAKVKAQAEARARGA